MDSAGAMCLLSVLCHFTAHRAASWQNWTDTVVTFLKVCVDCSRKNGNPTFFLCMCEGLQFICKEEKDSLINLRGVSVVTGIGYVVCVAWYLTHTASVFTGFGDGISVFILVIHTFGFYAYLWSARVIIACSLGSVLLLVDNSYVWNGICILITAYYS